MICCFSARVMPPAGKVIRAEPPPEISAMTRSSALNPCTNCNTRAAAAAPAASGTGCAASTISICLQGQA